MFITIRKISWKGFKYVFLPTLPLTFFPLLTGVINGILFSLYHERVIHEGTEKFMYSVKAAANDWGVPGFTFRDFQDTNNDHHVMRINSNDWTKKLSFYLPREYVDGSNPNTPIDLYADLENLMADMVCSGAPPKEQWVYLAEYIWLDKYTEWGQAFSKARQHAYAPSKLNESNIFLAECSGTADFLCSVWQVQAPALIHFKVEDEPFQQDDLPTGLSYDADYKHLHRVTVRVIEFPLEEDVYLGLSTGVFPGYEEQVLSIMKDSDLVEQFETYSAFEQKIKRATKYVNDIYDIKGTSLYYINEIDTWMTENVAGLLWLDDVLAVLYELTWASTFIVAELGFFWPLLKVTEMVNDYLGKPKRGDIIMANDEYNPSDPLNGWNLMDGLFGGMGMAFEQVMAKAAKDNLREQQAKDAITPVPTPTSATA